LLVILIVYQLCIQCKLNIFFSAYVFKAFLHNFIQIYIFYERGWLRFFPNLSIEFEHKCVSDMQIVVYLVDVWVGAVGELLWLSCSCLWLLIVCQVDSLPGALSLSLWSGPHPHCLFSPRHPTNLPSLSALVCLTLIFSITRNLQVLYSRLLHGYWHAVRKREGYWHTTYTTKNV